MTQDDPTTNESTPSQAKVETPVGLPQKLLRWRLILGKFAQPSMPRDLAGDQQRMALALEHLYGRAHAERGARRDPRLGPGSLDPSQLTIPKWLAEIRQLFPQSTCQTITEHALDRYGMTELVQDPETLASLEPSTELLSAVLALKGQMNAAVLDEARRLIRRVVEQLREKLERPIQSAFSGRTQRFRQSLMKVARNFDALRTIRSNLQHWDRENRRLVVERPRFNSRLKRHLPWDVVLCVDQSGSMASNVIHSAVMAGILASLPAVRLRFVLFDTAVVDVSEHATDPVQLLMSVQLGGGTDIGKALRYCEQLISQPTRTILVLVTDFCEGADPRVLVTTTRRLAGSGVKLIGLASLETNGEAMYDEAMASRLASEGMKIAALTPDRLAEWVAQIIR